MTEELDGVTAATFVLLGNLMTTLLKRKVLSPEDIREVLDTAISKFESSSLDIELFRDARKFLDGALAEAFGGPRGRKQSKWEPKKTVSEFPSPEACAAPIVHSTTEHGSRRNRRWHR